MTGRMIAVAICAAALFGAGAARGQENLDHGKTPAQLFASDCAICHKSPRGLSKSGGLFGLQSFLRAHYTASVQSAASLAAYLQAVDRQARPPRKRTTRRPPKNPPAPKARPKPAGEEKAGEPKKSAQPDEAREAAKPNAVKPDAESSVEPKPPGTKPPEGESSEARASSPESGSKTEAQPAPGSRSEAMSGMTPGEAKANTPKSEAGDSVPDIIKPEKTE